MIPNYHSFFYGSEYIFQKIYDICNADQNELKPQIKNQKNHHMNTKKGTAVIVSVFAITAMFSCGGGAEQKPAADQPAAPKEEAVKPAALTKDQKLTKGKEVYTKICITCHQADGKGVENAFPPLAGSDYLAADLKRAMHGAANGLSGEITVNGKKYNSAMPKPNPDLSDEELASVFTYVLNNFGNKGGEVSVDEAAAARK